MADQTPQAQHVRLYDPTSDTHLLPQINQIHAGCITQDDQCLSLMPPLTETRLSEFWDRQIALVRSGDLDIILAFEPNGKSSESGGEGDVAGVVCLGLPRSETGAFRGVVLTLIVSPSHRRKGVAKRLMVGLEGFARGRGRTLLTLDTTVGTQAVNVYPRLGYKECGRIPNYIVTPMTHELRDEVFFYKNLREM